MSERGSPWLTGHPPRFPPLQSAISADVVVVGGGITGLTAAYVLQRRGYDVVVVEADQIGSGTTGGTTAKVTSQHGVIYSDLIDRHGREVASAYATANQDAVDFIRSTAGASAVECGLVTASACVYAIGEEEHEILARECDVAVSLGLPARMRDGAELPFPVAGVLEFTEQAHLHPVRYCRLLATELARLGGAVFENSRITDLAEDADHVVVSSADGSVTADHAVVATLLPFIDRSGLFARTTPWRAYGVAGRLRRPPPGGMYIGAGFPVRSFRPWPDGGETGIVFVGESHHTGDDTASPARWGALERWAREHFEVESFDYRWSAQDYDTPDLLPFVGRSPLARRTYVAAGFRKWGLSNGTAGAMMIADQIQGIANPQVALFSPSRWGDARALVTVVRGNAAVAAKLTGDIFRHIGAQEIAELGLGEGGLVRVDGRKAAAYRSPEGELHALSPRCTHLGCMVAWNSAEKSWDCACHGSRFDIDGAIRSGPATRPLEPFSPQP